MGVTYSRRFELLAVPTMECFHAILPCMSSPHDAGRSLRLMVVGSLEDINKRENQSVKKPVSFEFEYLIGNSIPRLRNLFIYSEWAIDIVELKVQRHCISIVHLTLRKVIQSGRLPDLQIRAKVEYVPRSVRSFT
jgi:hypothetical protein